MKKIFTLLFICGIFATTVSKAQLALKEDFIYPAGPLVNVINPYWKNISGTASQLQVTSGGLTYTGYKPASALTNKISLVAGKNGGSEDVIGFIDTNGDAVVDNKDSISLSLVPVLYYSFLINVTDTAGLTANSGAGDYFSGIVPAVNSTLYTARVYIRKGSTDGYQVGLKVNSNASNVAAWVSGVGDNMVTGTTYLLAFRYTSMPGANDDVMDMWVNPVLTAGTIPTPLITVTNLQATGTSDLTKLGGILFRQATNTPSMGVDAIAVGVSWDDVLLPISLNAFNAALQNNTALLNWASSNELNLKGFTIERSMDGGKFDAIGFVAANNNSGIQHYGYSDLSIKPGMNYYRLKIIDIDGSFKYSSVVAIMNKQFAKTTIFPNPVRKNLTIAHEIAGDAAVVRILDMSGKQVYNLNLQKGASQTSISLPVMAAGAYTLVVENGGQKTVSRFVKE